MEHKEGELKSAFFTLLRQQLPHFIVLAQATAGAPDKAIVGNGRTTFLEFKHGTPRFTSRGNQELFCMRLAHQGFCRYVLWQEYPSVNPRTLIVHPKFVCESEGGTPTHIEAWAPGFNHQFVVDYLKAIHGV